MKNLEQQFGYYVPAPVDYCKKISCMAGRFYAKIVGLAKKFGYIFASDEYLAEMMEVSTRTIKRWLKQLEIAGFIQRVTQNRPREGADGKFSWRTERKIYINPLEQTEPSPDSGGTIETPDNDTGVTPSSSPSGVTPEAPILVQAITNIKEQQPAEPGVVFLPDQKITQDAQAPLAHQDKQKVAKEEEPSAKDSEVRQSTPPVSSLDQLTLTNSQKFRILKQYCKDQIDRAVARCLKWKTRESDIKAVLYALKNPETWNDEPTAAQVEEQNKKFLAKLRNLDNIVVNGVRIVVGNKYIEFSAGMKLITFSIDSKTFETDVTQYLESLGFRKAA